MKECNTLEQENENKKGFETKMHGLGKSVCMF